MLCKVWFVLFLLGATACSLRPLETSKLSISFQAERRAPLDWTEFLEGSSSRSLNRALLTPLYACVGVNIVGNGVPSMGGGGGEDIVQRLQGLYAGQSCTYQGVFRGMFPTSGSNTVEFNLDVPVGPSRVVQVGGADAIGGVCDATGQQEQDIFEWGRAIIDVFGPSSVLIQQAAGASYRDQAKRMNCGGRSIAQIPGKILWLNASKPCHLVPDGTAGTWVSEEVGQESLTRQGSPICNTDAATGKRYVKSLAVGTDFFSTTIPSADPRLSNREGLTFFVVNRFSSSAAATGEAIKFISSPHSFAIQQTNSGAFQLNIASASLGVSQSHSDTSNMGAINSLRVIGARVKEADGVKLVVYDSGGNDYLGFQSAAFARYNPPTPYQTTVEVGRIGSSQSMDLFEVVAFDRPLSDDEFYDAMDDLTSKYGI